MTEQTPEAHRLLAAAAERHGVSLEAASAVLQALAAGGGTMAQFNHPELGGVGQWSQGGMTMVGDMFNHGLKHRVDALCSELAGQTWRHRAAPGPAQAQSQSQSGTGQPSVPLGSAGSGWWPAHLGSPASSGAQNDFRYAYFPTIRRLVIQWDGRLTLYDTGDHRIFGVSQQQGAGLQSPTFSSDTGDLRLTDLKAIDAGAPAHAEPLRDAGPAGPKDGDPLTMIERLAGLHQKGILTDAEFTAKKAELLARL